MAESIPDNFARIVALARSKLQKVESSQEIDAERAILSVQGERLVFRIFLKETLSAKGRRYAYYSGEAPAGYRLTEDGRTWQRS